MNAIGQNHAGARTALGLVAVLVFGFLAGCGGAAAQQNKDFYTSGSSEADERADQRMAQAQQLKGEGQDPASASVPAEDKRSLYDRLGGQAGLSAIVDDFVDRAMADPRVNWDRSGVEQGGLSVHMDRSMQWDANPDNVKAVKLHIVQFLSVASGGPSLYQGREMRDAHKNLHISNAEFDASVGDLKATLDKMQVANKEQKELLAIIETTRSEIVEEQ
jgi:hemoglobin